MWNQQRYRSSVVEKKGIELREGGKEEGGGGGGGNEGYRLYLY